MGHKKRDKTTIIFLNKGQNHRKPIQIRTHYLEHWKKFAFALILFILGLVSTIFYMAGRQKELKQTAFLLEKQLEEQKKEFAQLDTSTIRKHYLSIDEKLSKINKYLKARGLKPIPKNQGGESSNDLGSTEEIGSYYEAYLKKMIKLIGFTPLGYPHKGPLSSNFGHRENPFTGENIERHKGLDIRGKYGETVKTTANGVVKFADWYGGYGKCVVIDHGNGFETYYGHLSKISVKKGQRVSVGDKIGNIGSTGRSTGPHLHYEIHRNGKVVNPKTYLKLE